MGAGRGCPVGGVGGVDEAGFVSPAPEVGFVSPVPEAVGDDVCSGSPGGLGSPVGLGDVGSCSSTGGFAVGVVGGGGSVFDGVAEVGGVAAPPGDVGVSATVGWPPAVAVAGSSVVSVVTCVTCVPVVVGRAGSAAAGASVAGRAGTVEDASVFAVAPSFALAAWRRWDPTEAANARPPTVGG